MNFGNSPRAQLTESFMENFSKFNPNAIIKLETTEYNKVYEAVYSLIGYINLKHTILDKIDEQETKKLEEKEK